MLRSTGVAGKYTAYVRDDPSLGFGKKWSSSALTLKRDGTALVPIVFGLALIVAATVWLGAIIGVITASWRAV